LSSKGKLDIITNLNTNLQLFSSVTRTNSQPNHSQPNHRTTAIMSMFGIGRPQPSSAEKIAAAEQEMDLVTDMFNKYFPFLPSPKPPN
jgi:hypothetical protein